VIRALYVDVDGTLVGPGGDALWGGSTRLVEALLRCRAAGLAVVPVTGRGRLQVRELCRLLGLPRAVGELGCVHVEGAEVRYELGRFPFTGRTPVEAMEAEGAIALVVGLGGLEPHDPWNEGREATFLLRGRADVAVANATLARHELGWCQLVDNGVLRGRDRHAFHLAPAGTGKADGVRIDRERHRLSREDVAYVGDAAADLACAAEVGQCWLVANADPALHWPRRTVAPYGDGVAELVDRLLA
jgi:hydroxymethylpyrimidine pyrophosphatase-like HAD family hydrolase